MPHLQVRLQSTCITHVKTIFLPCGMQSEDKILTFVDNLDVAFHSRNAGNKSEKYLDESEITSPLKTRNIILNCIISYHGLDLLRIFHFWNITWVSF